MMTMMPMTHTARASYYQYKHTPDAEHIYWMYSPEGDGFTFFKTEEERARYAEEEIRTYLDEGEWFPEVEGIFAGTVTHLAQETNIKRIVGELDEDGFDEADEYWRDAEYIDYKCDYALLPIKKSE